MKVVVVKAVSSSTRTDCRYLQDYGMGPETPVGEPKNKYMELGPRDKEVSPNILARAAEKATPSSTRLVMVHLDLRHLGEEYLQRASSRLSVSLQKRT